MRILAIRGKNLASLAEPFEIVLNTGVLEHVGLFAITGQTGAGKSTILDALCLALYDKIPRLPDGHGFAVGHKDEDDNLRVTSNDVRSILRRGTSHAYAEVDFIGKDKQAYRARWEVSKARNKVEGRLQAQDVTLSNIVTGQRIGQGKKSTLEAISELIDLNFEQFRRSILLAQGDFAAFLKAKKDERSSLLERITGTDIYSELSIAAFERARLEKEALNQISSRIQDQIPLGEADRLALEQQRDQFISQLVSLDKQLLNNQDIIDWYAKLKKYQDAERVAREALSNSQESWDEAETGRRLIQKIEAVQPLRPLSAQYTTANTEHQDAWQQLQNSSDQLITADIDLQKVKAQLTVLASTLEQAEQQQQQAQPLLITARALDTRIDVMQQAVSILSTEENIQHETRDIAEREYQSLLSKHAEQNFALQQLKLWLEQHQAIKAVATEWNRWQAELERYQTFHTRKTDDEHKATQLRQAIVQDEPRLAELKLAIDNNEQQLALHHETVAQLKIKESQRSLEDLLRSKDKLNIQREQITVALGLAQTANELQQTIQQDASKLIAIEQTFDDSTEQVQTLNQQKTVNDIALDEAKKALELIQATTHKNARQFRALLRENQPCPVCGALEHPWKEQTSLGNEHAAAQSVRVAELESQHEILIKTIAAVTQAISQALEQKTVLVEKMAQAQTKLEQCSHDWTALSLPDKPDFAITEPQLLPVLNSNAGQIMIALATIKQQEDIALELQKQIKTAQGLFDATRQIKENQSIELMSLDKQQTKNKADLEHFIVAINDIENQMAHIIEILAIPFRQLEGWQHHLQTSATAFKQECAEKVHDFLHNEQQIEVAAKTLENIIHDEKLAEQRLNQCQQQHQLKLEALKSQTEALQKLTDERASVLPIANADSYEQTINQNLQTAKTTHQQIADSVKKTENELASHKQAQQHWQTESERRYRNLEKAQDTLNESLEKQSITREYLGELLEKDENWLAEQKNIMAALERSLQESAALLKVKAEDCLKHQSQVVDISEEAASLLLNDLQQRRQAVYSQKEEQVILLREDDKKIEAGRLLKAGLEQQQCRWEQWESLNELIGSKNGVKFRTFAQSLTLEALLAHSNQHLEDFAKRYALQRVPGSDLELQIIDRDMADDVRSVHSLSGGESFLVSLALALGLASLSSNKTQVESLFIDEGFGSLDSETLDIAIASLDTLQALGRKVGVISHVPILVERIGAKVVVEKLGGGRSRVVIAGS